MNLDFLLNVDFFQNTGFGKMLITFLVAMVPVVELRGALPIGVVLGLHPLASYVISVAGNILPLPFILIFIQKIFGWLRVKSDFFSRKIQWLENRAHAKSDVVQKYALLGLYIFVAIPLPGTGGWTGALIAALMEMRLKRALPAIALGVMTAGVIMLIITYGVSALL